MERGGCNVIYTNIGRLFLYGRGFLMVYYESLSGTSKKAAAA